MPCIYIYVYVCMCVRVCAFVKLTRNSATKLSKACVNPDKQKAIWNLALNKRTSPL